MTDERLRRIFVGAPYAVLRYVGLDMWGWVIGTTLFYLTLLGGFFACCMLNCCGAARVIQAVTRRSRDGMPFTDMVSNRVTSASFNGVLFMFPFVILSTVHSSAEEAALLHPPTWGQLRIGRFA